MNIEVIEEEQTEAPPPKVKLDLEWDEFLVLVRVVYTKVDGYDGAGGLRDRFDKGFEAPANMSAKTRRQFNAVASDDCRDRAGSVIDCVLDVVTKVK